MMNGGREGGGTLAVLYCQDRQVMAFFCPVKIDRLWHSLQSRIALIYPYRSTGCKTPTYLLTYSSQGSWS